MKRVVFLLLAIMIFFSVALWLFPSNKKSEKIVLKVNRFEKELFSINLKNINEKSNKWDQEFGSFTDFFATQIMHISRLDTLEYYSRLLAFTKDKDIHEAYDSIAL